MAGLTISSTATPLSARAAAPAATPAATPGPLSLLPSAPSSVTTATTMAPHTTNLDFAKLPTDLKTGMVGGGGGGEKGSRSERGGG
jgi:hypothetical protein